LKHTHERRDNLHLNQVLDEDHVARTALYSDTPRYIPANTEGITMTRYVTLKRARNTQSIRDGTGLSGRGQRPQSWRHTRDRESRS